MRTSEILKKSWIKIRYGLVLQFLRDKLGLLSIEISPWYWVQEGIEEIDPPEIADIENYNFEFLTPDDMKIIGNLPNRPILNEAALLKRLRNGNKCLGIKYKGEIAAFNWFNYDECSNYYRKIKLKKNEVYLYDMLTMKKFRGKNLAPLVRIESYKILKDQGYSVFYSISEYFNAPSVKFKRKLKAKFLELILRIGLFNKYNRSITLKKYKNQ